MEKSYWLFVDWTSFMLTADPQLIETNTLFPQNINDQMIKIKHQKVSLHLKFELPFYYTR